MTTPVGWMTGEAAAAETGYTIAQIDKAAANGACPAMYWGWQLLVTYPDQPPAVGVNEVQHIAIVGGPNGGSFTLSFNGQPTSAIAYHPSATQLQNALVALPGIGPGNVAVGKPGNWDYDVTFQGALGQQNVSQLVPNYGQLKPTGSTSVVVTTTTAGSATRAAKKTAAKKAAKR